MTTPRATALLDQAQAAAGHAMGMLHAAAERLSTEVEEGHPGPVARAVFERFIERMLSGRITLCPHLSWGHRNRPRGWRTRLADCGVCRAPVGPHNASRAPGRTTAVTTAGGSAGPSARASSKPRPLS